MAKWHGKIGYSKQVLAPGGVWKPQDTVYEYTGDFLRNFSNASPTPESTNDDLKIDVQISIVADQFAYQNFYSMKWIELYGAKWKITKVEPRYPRLILSVGGVYNG